LPSLQSYFGGGSLLLRCYGIFTRSCVNCFVDGCIALPPHYILVSSQCERGLCVSGFCGAVVKSRVGAIHHRHPKHF